MGAGKDSVLVDAQGRLVLPAELAGRFGLRPGARVSIDEGPHGLLLRRPITHLSRVYVESTTQCNLEAAPAFATPGTSPWGG